MELTVAEFLDLKETGHLPLFEGCAHPWEAIPRIGGYLKSHLWPAIHGKVSPMAVIEGPVFIGEGTVVEPNVFIRGPAWIGANCEIRQGAYLRGNVIAGDGCVLGNSCEFKNSILFNGAQVPHFAYVGDSVLGHEAHLASHVVLSNLKITPGNIRLELDGKVIDTGLRKFGAVIGDHAEAGCHCVLNPGSLLGRRALLYPGVSWRGVCPADTLVKLKQEHTLAVRRG